MEKEIILNYDYKNIKVYENMINSIGYVVAKYSMGYDFKNLDFIYISDPKLSIQDIKQCIGRGIRPDELGINGANKEKILIVSLPVYIDENNYNNYEKIIEVLKYLLYDIEIPFEEIDFKNRVISNINKENNSNEYLGTNNIKSILLNLLSENTITYEKAKKIIADKNIKNIKSYYELCDNDNRLSKEPQIIFKEQFTNWIEYLSIDRIYYDLETCKNKINEYLLIYPNLNIYCLDLTILCSKLCIIDNLFPSDDLWIDYYNVNNLRDLIFIHNKKIKLLNNTI